MQKLATIFLLIVSLGLVLAGAVSAQGPATVDVTVINETGDNVTVTVPGDEVAADVVASAHDQTVGTPNVFITVDPETGLQFEPYKAMMWDGVQWIANDPTDPTTNFFFKSDWHPGVWVWNIYLIHGNMQPGDVVELIAPAIVSDTGNITVNADLYAGPTLLTQDSYTFLSVDPSNSATANAATVPMQNTGAPIGLAALALIGIMGGTIYNRLR